MEHRPHSPDIFISDDSDTLGNQRPGKLTPNVAQNELLEAQQMGGPVNCSDSELSIFLRALAEEYLPTYYSDISQSAQSKLMSIASKSYLRGKKTVRFHGFPSLQISKNSMASHGEAFAIFCAEDSRAKISAPLEKEPESRGSDPVFGKNMLDAYAKFDPATLLWRTPQCSLGGDYPLYLGIWPRWGTMRNGCVYRQESAGRHTKGIEYGYSQKIPTPSGVKGRGHCAGAIGEWGGSKNIFRGMGIGNVHCPRFEEWVMDWPDQWTALIVLETGRFQLWLQERSWN